MFSFFGYSWFDLGWAVPNHLFVGILDCDSKGTPPRTAARAAASTTADTICQCSGRKHRENVFSEH